MSNHPAILSPRALPRLPNYQNDPAVAPSSSSKEKKDDSDHVSRQLVNLGLLSPKHVVARERIVRGPGAAEAYPKKKPLVTRKTRSLLHPLNYYYHPLNLQLNHPQRRARTNSFCAFCEDTLKNLLTSRYLRDSEDSARSAPPQVGIARYEPSEQTGSSGSNSRANNSTTTLSRGAMTGMLDTDREPHAAGADEPLEHTLRGERILQFSCGHVSHGACFYEYMKEFDSRYCPTCNAPLGLDTSRGGNVLDIGKGFDHGLFALPPADIGSLRAEKLSSMVRSVSVSERGSATPTPTPWDSQTVRPPSYESGARPSHDRERDSQSRNGRESASGHRDSGRDRDGRDRERDRDGRERERYPSSSGAHRRSDSEATGSNGYPETTSQSVAPSRRHDYDVQSMDTGVTSPRSSRNPIPPPLVSIRSEFPTLNRSRAQQTLACLITIEVPDNNWRPDPEDVRIPPMPKLREEERYARPPSPVKTVPRFYPYESPEVLEEMTESLRSRVENWHSLDFSRFGKLRLYGTIRVGKDKVQWQELECYLFSEMLICVKEKKATPLQQWSDEGNGRKTSRCTLKGSILIRKHLNGVTQTAAGDTLGMTQRITSSNLTPASNPRPLEENTLTLSLSVAELPQFHLQFDNLTQLRMWQQALQDLHSPEAPSTNGLDYDHDAASEAEEDDWRRTLPSSKRDSSLHSSSYAGRSATTAPTDYRRGVVPVSSSMQGVKISLVRDALNYMVQNLGERDRMGLVTFGSGGGGVPLVGMTTKTWSGWSNVLSQIKPVGQKLHRADVVEGANVAMDLLMQRKNNNPIATILLISDASTSDTDSVDFVASRAEAAKIAIHSFGLGMTHKPDTMIELSTRTKAQYTYVKDWMMLRECLAGCLGSLQTTSHQNVKLRLRLPEGSPAKFVKISGALSVTRRASGRDAEACLGDLRFGDERDVLVQLVITPDAASPDHSPSDPWETIMSNLEALSGPLEHASPRALSVEEVPLIQADLTNRHHHRPHPSLLTPLSSSAAWSSSQQTCSPAALALVARGQHERAAQLLTETRSILKGLAKGGLPPIPPPPPTGALPLLPLPGQGRSSRIQEGKSSPPSLSPTASIAHLPPMQPPPSAALPTPREREQSVGPATAAGIDPAVVAALDAELEGSLEWIHHPAVFGRDSRKAVLQAVGVIGSQRVLDYAEHGG
ncbi:hypothetical protein VE04_09427, partial [Pseudogymnoascus sp. 24MN13]